MELEKCHHIAEYFESLQSIGKNTNLLIRNHNVMMRVSSFFYNFFVSLWDTLSVIHFHFTKHLNLI